MALEQTTGFTQKALWYSAYGTYPKIGRRHNEPDHAALYLQPGGEGAHRQGGEIPGGDQEHQGRHPARSDDAGVYQEILKRGNLNPPVGEVKALPNSAYTGS